MKLSKRDFYTFLVLGGSCFILVIVFAGLHFIPRWKQQMLSQAEKAAAAEKLQAERQNGVDAFVRKRILEEKRHNNEAIRRAQEIQNSFKPEIRLLRDTEIFIRNSGIEKWDSVNIFINSEPPDGYAGRLENIKPAESRTVPLSKFVKSDGKRFNPYAYKVLYVWIGNDQIQYQKYSF